MSGFSVFAPWLAAASDFADIFDEKGESENRKKCGVPTATFSIYCFLAGSSLALSDKAWFVSMLAFASFDFESNGNEIVADSQPRSGTLSPNSRADNCDLCEASRLGRLRMVTAGEVCH